jgi:Phosphate-induced protein 1 conserved region
MKASLGKTKYALALLLVMLVATSLLAQRVREGSTPDGHKNVPNGDGSTTLVPDTGAAPTGNTVTLGNGINYNGGPVLKGNPVPIYIIWYGNWNGGAKPSDSQTTVNLIQGFLGSNSLGGSSYEAINTTYGDTTGNVSGHLNFAGAVFDNYSQGTKVSDRKLQAIVNSHVGHDLPADVGAVYLVLTSSDVNETSGFCTRYCGFHTRATLNGLDIKYSFVGNSDRCPSGCEIQSTGPNSPAPGVGGADGMSNVITHETEEAITDPDLNAWFDSSGQEDADKCNFKFGPTQTAANGARFNQTFGGHNWMIQMEWENSRGGGCDQTLGGPFFTN